MHPILKLLEDEIARLKALCADGMHKDWAGGQLEELVSFQSRLLEREAELKKLYGKPEKKEHENTSPCFPKC
jgi:hypothetical protein